MARSAFADLRHNRLLLAANVAALPHISTNYIITKAGSLCAITVAAPSTVEDVTRITVTSATAFAHTITFTGATLRDGTGANKTTATFPAQVGASITFLSFGSLWYLESNNLVVLT